MSNPATAAHLDAICLPAMDAYEALDVAADLAASGDVQAAHACLHQSIAHDPTLEGFCHVAALKAEADACTGYEFLRLVVRCELGLEEGQRPARLTTAQRATLATVRNANREGHGAFPGVTSTGGGLACRRLAALLDRGLVEQVEPGSAARGWSVTPEGVVEADDLSGWATQS